MAFGFSLAVMSVFSSSLPTIRVLHLPVSSAAVLLLLSDVKGWFLPFLAQAAGF